jgi:hypothetical protein
MFSLPAQDVKRIVESKPGNRRGESSLDKLGAKFMENQAGKVKARK